jgi:hypothetical protein
MYNALLMTSVTSRLQAKACKAGPSSILSFCCLQRDIDITNLRQLCGSHPVLPSDEDKWLHAPSSPVRTLSRPALNPLIVCTCDSDFSMGASQQTSSYFLRNKVLLMQYLFSRSARLSSQAGFPSNAKSGQNPHASHPVQCNQSRLCVLNPVRRSQFNRSVAPNSIKVTQFNQMTFWFFLGLLDCCRKQLKPRFPRSEQCCWVSWTAGLLPGTAKTKDSRARNNAAGFLGLLDC